MAGVDRGQDHETGARLRVAEWWRWAIVAAYLTLIFLLSSQSKLPDLPGFPGPEHDKLQHFLGYLVMGALVAWASVRGDWTRMSPWTVLATTGFCLLYGLSDELHQATVPERKFDLWDLAADGAGAFVAATASWAWGIIARGSRPAHDV